MNILIVEDNPMIQALNGELMRYWGYTFDVASDGIEAVALVKKNKGKYDLCLMDVEMPKMNGIEATKVIRKIANYFPIMGLTTNDTYKKACYEAGMDDFAVKPCLPEELSAKINELSVKLYKLITKPYSFGITKVMPMDKQHAEELRELAEKGLRKLTFFDSPSRAVIVHKNVINKISHDFNVKGQLLTTFINRDEDKPTLCHLFKESNYLLPQTLLMEEEYLSMLAEEDSELEYYSDLSLKAKEK